MSFAHTLLGIRGARLIYSMRICRWTRYRAAARPRTRGRKHIHVRRGAIRTAAQRQQSVISAPTTSMTSIFCSSGWKGGLQEHGEALVKAVLYPLERPAEEIKAAQLEERFESYGLADRPALGVRWRVPRIICPPIAASSLSAKPRQRL